VGDLSGGEKGRLSLAKLIYSRVNVLVLDEPTNHLDIPSRESLEEALDAYDGTIITISHDRYFLDRVATQILALDGEGHAEHYNGDYTEYHDWKAGRSESSGYESEPRLVGVAGGLSSQSAKSAQTRKSGKESASKPRTFNKKNERSSASDNSGRIRVIKKPRDSSLIEAEISELEKRLAELAEEMCKPEVARDITKLVKANEDYEQAETRLAALLEEWERAETTQNLQGR
jgi:ATP-binding cassette, subfamily F, member 3